MDHWSLAVFVALYVIVQGSGFYELIVMTSTFGQGGMLAATLVGLGTRFVCGLAVRTRDEAAARA